MAPTPKRSGRPAKPGAPLDVALPFSEQQAGEQVREGGEHQRGVAEIVVTRLVARNRDASHPRGPRRAHAARRVLTTTHAPGATPSRLAVSRHTSGAGLPRATSTPETTASNSGRP